MNLETYPPSDFLKPFVDKFMIIRSEHGMENHIVPDTSVVMAFRLSGRISLQEDDGGETELPRSVVTGLRNSSRRINYANHSAVLLVVFHEGGAGAFMRKPVHELFGLHLPAEYLLSRSHLSKTEDQLAETVNTRQRISLVENLLFSQLKEPQADRLVTHSIQKIKSVNGILKIQDLIEDLPVSRDPFEKRFRRFTGTSPKQFSGIVRLRHIIENHSRDRTLTETAHSAGYFDQSHFIKDFKSFTGQTPKTFFASPSFW